MWGERSATRYEKWVNSPRGNFALLQEQRLVQRLVAAWPRRRQKLLEIGCGTGLFLKLFWEAGFDVTGIDSSPAMLEHARTRMGPRAELHLGQADHLPFDDREFDYSVLITVLEFCPDPETVLKEVRRITRKGILIGFLNRNSWYYLTHGRKWSWSSPSLLRQAHWYGYLQMRRMISNALGPRPVTSRSVLPAPTITWRNTPPFRQMNSIILPPALGAFMGMRIDLVADRAVNPLFALNRNKKTHANAHMQPIARVEQDLPPRS